MSLRNYRVQMAGRKYRAANIGPQMSERNYRAQMSGRKCESKYRAQKSLIPFFKLISSSPSERGALGFPVLIFKNK
jgi:hypothetical protein